MQMSQVLSINRVFLHKLHHPPCYLGNLPTTADNFTRMIVTLGPNLKAKKGLSSIPSKWLPQDFGTIFLTKASARVWYDGASSWLWNFPPLSSAGKVPQVRWVGNLFSRSKDFTMFFTRCYFKLRHRKRRPFISEWDVRSNDFRTLRRLSTVFFHFKISMRCWDFNHVINEVRIPYLLGYKPRPQTPNL